MRFVISSPNTLMFDCSAIYRAIMEASRLSLEEAYEKAEDESSARIIKHMLNAIDNDNYSAFRYYQWCLEHKDTCVDNNPQIGFLSTGTLQKLRVSPMMQWKNGLVFAGIPSADTAHSLKKILRLRRSPCFALLCTLNRN